jgi:Mor family transcriptional regulator
LKKQRGREGKEVGNNPMEQSLFDDLAEKNRSVSIPREAEEKDLEKDDVYEELVELVGEEAAKRIVDYYSGTNVYYPKRISLRLKHRQIRNEFKNGAGYRELSSKYGYGERYIRIIIHGKERDK